LPTVFQPVGVDVSKDTLDVALVLPQSKPVCGRFLNREEVYPEVVTWMQGLAQGPLHVCLEATGTYHDAFLAALFAHSITVSVLPSNRLKAFRESEGIRSKTDKTDAILLARYCQQKMPAPTPAVPETLWVLRTLLTTLAQLEETRQQERNRLGNTRLHPVSKAAHQRVLQVLDQERKEHLKLIRDWIKKHAELATALKLLRSIRGIGERTGWSLLSVLGTDASRFPSARHLVLYAGVDVARRDSGKRKAGQISKRGPAALRKVLGMAAIVAKRWDTDMKRWAAELRGRGKKGRQVRVAIMRKLLHLAYGVLTSQQAYDPLRAWPTHAHEISVKEGAVA
jgi:transposase